MRWSRHFPKSFAILFAFIFIVGLAHPNSGTAGDDSTSTPEPTETPALVSTGYTSKLYLPLLRKSMQPPPAPPTTTSLYMKTTDSTMLYNLGKDYGSTGVGGVVIMDFGKPAKSGTNYGTILFNGFFTTTTSIQTASQRFLAGWWDGYNNLGGASIAPSAQITLAVGTSNCGPWVAGDSDLCMPGGDSFYGGHGQAWGQLVLNVRNWIASPPSYASKEFVVAGNDIELGYNYSTTTKGWVDSYYNFFTSVAITNTIQMYNYGACDSCPYTLPDGGGCPSCIPSFTRTRADGTQVSWTWTLTDVRYVFWGAFPAWPLVENYRTDSVQAYQWYSLSRFSYDNFGGNRIRYLGTLTQSQYCQQATGCPDSLKNTPQEGWSQLWSAIDADPATRLNIQRDMLYATDIKVYPYP